jgi:hypothetical protein
MTSAKPGNFGRNQDFPWIDLSGRPQRKELLFAGIELGVYVWIAKVVSAIEGIDNDDLSGRHYRRRNQP